MADPTPRRRLVLGALWVCGTVLAMAASIMAINLAGAKVTGPASFSAAHVGQAADVSNPATTSTGAPGSGPAADSTGATASTDLAASGAPIPASQGASGTTDGRGSSPSATTPTTAPSSGSGAPGATTTTTTHSSPPTTSSPVTTQAPPPSSVRSVTVTGGTVRVQCIADAATLLADPPDAGFEAEASRVSTSTLHVEFDKGDVSSEVTAVCADGVITFHTETSTDG